MTGYMEPFRGAMSRAAAARVLSPLLSGPVLQADDGPRDATWGVARGPDATTKGPRPLTRCPVCSKPGRPVMVEAARLVEHGMGHRRAAGLEPPAA